MLSRSVPKPLLSSHAQSTDAVFCCSPAVAVLKALIQSLLQPSCSLSAHLKMLRELLLCCLAVMQQHGTFVSFWWCKDALLSLLSCKLCHCRHLSRSCSPTWWWMQLQHMCICWCTMGSRYDDDDVWTSLINMNPTYKLPQARWKLWQELATNLKHVFFCRCCECWLLAHDMMHAYVSADQLRCCSRAASCDT